MFWCFEILLVRGIFASSHMICLHRIFSPAVGKARKRGQSLPRVICLGPNDDHAHWVQRTGQNDCACFELVKLLQWCRAPVACEAVAATINALRGSRNHNRWSSNHRREVNKELLSPRTSVPPFSSRAVTAKFRYDFYGPCNRTLCENSHSATTERLSFLLRLTPLPPFLIRSKPFLFMFWGDPKKWKAFLR